MGSRPEQCAHRTRARRPGADGGGEQTRGLHGALRIGRDDWPLRGGQGWRGPEGCAPHRVSGALIVVDCGTPRSEWARGRSPGGRMRRTGGRGPSGCLRVAGTPCRRAIAAEARGAGPGACGRLGGALWPAHHGSRGANERWSGMAHRWLWAGVLRRQQRRAARRVTWLLSEGSPRGAPSVARGHRRCLTVPHPPLSRSHAGRTPRRTGGSRLPPPPPGLGPVEGVLVSSRLVYVSQWCEWQWDFASHSYPRSIEHALYTLRSAQVSREV